MARVPQSYFFIDGLPFNRTSSQIKALYNRGLIDLRSSEPSEKANPNGPTGHLFVRKPVVRQAVSEQERFHLNAERWRVLFRQIEIAEDLAKRLAIPELIELLTNLDREAHQVFRATNSGP